MADDIKDDGLERLWLDLGRAKQQSYNVKKEDKSLCEKAEELVNNLWGAWMNKYVANTEEEVNSPVYNSEVMMSRVAFRLARLYLEERNKNSKMEEVLAGFEKKLDDIIVKVD